MCEFCEGKQIPMTSVMNDGRFYTMGFMLGHTPAGFIQLEMIDGEPYISFDNSCGEYCAGAAEINYCPMCGRKLKGEDIYEKESGES